MEAASRPRPAAAPAAADGFVLTDSHMTALRLYVAVSSVAALSAFLRLSTLLADKRPQSDMSRLAVAIELLQQERAITFVRAAWLPLAGMRHLRDRADSRANAARARLLAARAARPDPPQHVPVRRARGWRHHGGAGLWPAAPCGAAGTARSGSPAPWKPSLMRSNRGYAAVGRYTRRAFRGCVTWSLSRARSSW